MEQLRFTDVSIPTVQAIMQRLAKMKSLPVLITRKSNHPDDNGLYLVLAERKERGTYVVWSYNHTTGSINGGAYDLPLADAMKVFAERLWDINAKL